MAKNPENPTRTVASGSGGVPPETAANPGDRSCFSQESAKGGTIPPLSASARNDSGNRGYFSAACGNRAEPSGEPSQDFSAGTPPARRTAERLNSAPHASARAGLDDAPAAALGWALVDLAHASEDFAWCWDRALDLRAAWLGVSLLREDTGPGDDIRRARARRELASAWSSAEAAEVRACWRVLVLAVGLAHEAAEAVGVRLPMPRLRPAERWAELDGAEVLAAFGGRWPLTLTLAGGERLPPPPALPREDRETARPAGGGS